ncbi:MAG TPA: ComEC/Rec2 family competence protein [Bacteroidia bacterium]|jgi:competence protein ComEC|nr:ComEC/Rec2 family competence protein [Bacteroidia bacterium]
MIFLSQIPFLRILLPFIVGIGFWLVGRQDSPSLIYVSGIFLICTLLYFLLIKSTQTIPKFLFGLTIQVFLFFSGWLLCNYNNEKQNPINYSHFLTDSTTSYMGYVSEIPVEKTKSIKAEITLQQIKSKGVWQNACGKIIVYFEKIDKAKNLETGNNIVFTGKLQEMQAPLNPHEFDYKAYLNLRNIFHSVYLREENWVVYDSEEKFSLFNLSQKIRRHLLDTYRASGLENTEFAMVSALVLGYDDEIDRPLLNAYSHTGTLHVLSVSGLHVGVIYLLLGYILAFLDKNKKTTWIKVGLIILVLWFFVLLSGFSAPAVRAAFMFSLILLGKTLFEQVETANIVLVSAFLSLCINPFWLADVGFQLSYIAVLGIIYLYPYFYNLFTFSWGFADKVWALCAVSIAAQLATLPITLYYFHQFPTLFLITNLILIPISTLVMYGGILILVLSKITVVANVLVWLTAFLIKIMNASALFFDGVPFCVIDNIHLSIINLVLLYVLIFLVFISIEHKSYKILMSSFAVATLIVLISIVFDLQAKKNNELVVYQSDKTNVLAVFSGSRYVQFSDTIPDDRLQSTLRENRIYHDVVFKDEKQLTATSLILVNHKKILFTKDVNLLSDVFVNAVKPDDVWIAGNSLKGTKIPKFICGQKNIVVSGKVRSKKNTACITNSYFTAKQGAFILSLR